LGSFPKQAVVKFYKVSGHYSITFHIFPVVFWNSRCGKYLSVKKAAVNKQPQERLRKTSRTTHSQHTETSKMRHSFAMCFCHLTQLTLCSEV